MYCKKCGKTLHDGDKFCSNCGTKVEPEFVPAFRKPAEPAPAAVPQQSETGTPRRNALTEDFNWDLDGYPTDNRKTEDIDFDWGSVVEEKQRNLFEREMRSRETEEPEENTIPEFLQGDLQDDASLEEAIFADMGALPEESTKVSGRSGRKSETIDKFFTFNRKNEELQNLLDQEYERIRKGQLSEEDVLTVSAGEHTASSDRHEEFDWTLPGDRFFERSAAENLTTAETPSYVCVVLAQPPKGYVSDEPAAEFGTVSAEPAGAEEETVAPQFPPSAETEKEETEKPQQPKLTFDDVFGSDDDPDDKPKKKGRVMKTIAIILCILVAAELVMIGIQYFAPDSAAGRAINRGYEYVFSLFSKEETKNDAPPAVSEPSETAELIAQKLRLNRNIAAVEADDTLVFQDGKDYGMKDFENTYTFTDEPWYEKEDGTTITYGEEVIGTVIQYYSSWVDKINGKNRDVLDFIDETSEFYTEIEGLSAEEGIQYGINQLSVGEIRSGGAGFYVLTSVVKSDSRSGEDTTERQIVCLEPVSKSMKIVDIKTI